MAFSPSQIFSSLIGQGATPSQAINLTAISGAESGFGARTISPVNTNGTTDFGVFQINSGAWPQYGGSAVNGLTLDQQSAAAVHIANTQGLTAWSTYNNGSYLSHLGAAQAAAGGLGGGDLGLGGGSSADYASFNDTPTLTDTTFDGLSDADIVGSDYTPGTANQGDGFSLFGSPSTPAGATTGYNQNPGSSGLGSGNSLFGNDSTSDATGSSVGYNNPGTSPYGSNDQGTPSLGGGVSQTGTNVNAPGASTNPQYTAGGSPVYITDLKGLGGDIEGAGKNVQTGANTVGSDIQQTGSGLAGTAASIINQGTSYFSSALVIIALVILGLVFVAFGLSLFGKRELAAAV